MTNPFLEQANPFAEPQEERNPFLVEARPERPTTQAAFAAAGAVARAPELPFAERHPFIDMLLVQPFREGADALVVAFTPQSQLDLIAQENPAEALELVSSGQRGLAFLASLPIGATFTKIPAAARVLGKAGSFLTGEFLSGNIYGAIQPLEEGESRIKSVLQEGAVFAGAGGVIGGSLTLAGRGLRRVILSLPRKQRDAAVKAAQQRIGQVDTQLRAQGTNINAIPPETRASIVTDVYQSVLRDIEPQRELDLDRIAREQADLDMVAEQAAFEPAPRLGPAARPRIKVGPEPIEINLPDPADEIVLTPEFKAPAKVEPQLQPAGLIRGAGAPERAKPGPRHALERIESDLPKTTHGRYRILDRGEWVGTVSVNRYPAEPDILSVGWVGPGIGAGSAGAPPLQLGPGTVKSFLRQVLRDFPGVKTIQAERTSGIHFGDLSPAGEAPIIDVAVPPSLAVPPGTMRAMPDGSIEVVAYRGVAKGRDPLHPGVGESTFMSDDPSVAARYRSTAQAGPPGGLETYLAVSPENTVSRIRVAFKKPYIVDDFAELDMGPETAARYRELLDKDYAGTLTREERMELQRLAIESPDLAITLARLRADGYDGVIVREGMEGMEVIALDQKAAKAEQTLETGTVKVPGYSTNAIFDWFTSMVMANVRRGSTLEGAVDTAARDFAAGEGKPNLYPEVKQALSKIAALVGEDVWARSQHMVTTIRGERAEMRRLLRNLQREAAENRLRAAAEDVGQSFELEPRAVTFGVEPPAGFQATALGERAEGVEGFVEQLAMTDAAVKSATARIDPLDHMLPDLRSARQVVEDAVDDQTIPRFRPSQRLARALDKALEREGPASTEGVLLELTSPTPDALSLEQRLPRTIRRRMAEDLSRSLARESQDLVEINPGELVRAQWAYGRGNPVVPQLDAMSTAVRMTDDQLETLANRMKNIAAGEGGFITGKTLAFMLGSGAEVASFNEDIAPSPAAQNTLRAIGGMLLAAAFHSNIRGWMQRSKFMRNFLLNANPSFLMSSDRKEAFRQFTDSLIWSRELAHNMRKDIDSVFPNKADWRNAIVAIEESDFANGVFPAEYHQLSPQQQRMVESLNLFNLAMGNLLQSEGVLKSYRRNYISHRLPPEAFQQWLQRGFRTLPTGGGFTKQRILTFRELEQWTAANGLPGPVTDLGNLQWRHVQEAYRAIGTTRLVKNLEGLGVIKDVNTNALIPPPPGWRALRIAGYGTKEAPEEVAKALENIASPAASKSELLNAADTVKSWWMRSIMFWFWEHGLNAARSAVLSSLNPTRYSEAWKAIERMDPGVLEAAKNGLNLRQRTDYAELAKSVEKLIQQTQRIPVLRQLARIGGGLMKFNETALWEKLVPTMQYMVYSKEMFKWGERTGGKFLPGTAEYKTAARRAADVANTVAGRLPTDLANPRLMQWARLVLFSPQWTTTRVAMLAHASGELGEILGGKMNPTEATYLPMQLRRVFYTIAGTWLISKALSGEEPEFNPRTHKFYAKTGLRNATGREVGFDITGFWQDDLKMFNAPFDYIAGRLNPTLRVVQETVSGRDYLGRPMTEIQRLENILRSFGPPTETLELAARAGQTALPGGTPGMTGGEALQRISGVLATANVATLPRPMDATIGKMAERILRAQGMPSDEQSIFELSRLIRGNLLAGHPLIDNRVITYLSYRRRTHQVQSPLAGPAEHLWQEGRRVLAEF